MITLICLDENITFKDCDDLRYYLYDVSIIGDVKREFIFETQKLSCDHVGFDDHSNEDMRNYITDYFTDLGYCNYTFVYKGQ